MPIRGLCDATYVVSMGLTFLKICHSAEFNKIIEAKTPLNLYD